MAVVTTGYVYGLFDSRQPLELGYCRYVGRTVQKLNERLSVHLRDAKKGNQTHRSYWIRSVINEGGTVVIWCLEAHENGDKLVLNDDLNTRERAWITSGREQGWNLTNHTDGGDGCLGLVHSAETRSKISEAKKNPSSETRAALSAARKRQANPMLGRQQTVESRAKISAAKVGYRHTESTIAKISRANTGKKRTLETRAKLSAASMGNKSNRGKVFSDERKAQMSVSMMGKNKGKKASDETRSKMSASHTGRVDSEETRAKKSASGKATWERRRLVAS